MEIKVYIIFLFVKLIKGKDYFYFENRYIGTFSSPYCHALNNTLFKMLDTSQKYNFFKSAAFYGNSVSTNRVNLFRIFAITRISFPVLVSDPGDQNVQAFQNLWHSWCDKKLFNKPGWAFEDCLLVPVKMFVREKRQIVDVY